MLRFLGVRHTPAPPKFGPGGLNLVAGVDRHSTARAIFHRPCCLGRPVLLKKALLNRVPARTAAGITRELGGFPQTPFFATTEGEQIFANYSPKKGHQLFSSVHSFSLI